MGFDQRSLDDYIDVAQRIADFRARYPEGCLRPVLSPSGHAWEITTVTGYDKDGKEITQTFIVYTAAAYRTADDPLPGIGVAWEVFPGRTPYTRGSELMNAETSAWGRAIVAVGASDSKKGIASRDEVAPRMWLKEPEVDQHGAATFAEQTRMQAGPVPGSERLAAVPDDDPWYATPPPVPVEIEEQSGTILPSQVKSIKANFASLGIKDEAQQHAMESQVTGRSVASTKDLSYREAQAVITALNQRAREGKRP